VAIQTFSCFFALLSQQEVRKYDQDGYVIRRGFSLPRYECEFLSTHLRADLRPRTNALEQRGRAQQQRFR